MEDSNKSEYSLSGKVNGIAVFRNAGMMVSKFLFTPSPVKWSRFITKIPCAHDLEEAFLIEAHLPQRN